MNVHHILVPTDLSRESLRPCAPVGQLARRLGARITLLNVVQDLRVAPHGAPFAPPVSRPDLNEDLDAAREKLEGLRGELGEGVEVEAQVVTAQDVPEAVAEWAQENAVDLIAISTHGRTGFRHLVLGSVAEAVLRHSHVPVLSFPRGKD